MKKPVSVKWKLYVWISAVLWTLVLAASLIWSLFQIEKTVFEGGKKEIISIEEFKGKKYFRLMSPLKTEEACLKCHAFQGYKVGDIRGGISISVLCSVRCFPERLWRLTWGRFIRLSLM